MTGALGTANGIQFELGNEPDQLARQGYRPVPYTFSEYLAEYEGYSAAVAPFAQGEYAAGMAGGSATWDNANAASFLSAESANLGTLTSHEYPLTACDGTSSITIPHLLSDNISNAFYRRFQPLVAAAAPFGVPVRAGEMNSVSCSGLAGVSNVFASSLWLLDSLFQLDLSGAAGMNLHTGSQSASQADLVYNAFYVNGTQVQVRPDYYGMLMFAEATQNHASLLPVSVQLTGTPNVKVWATLDAGHKLRIVVIEKDIDSGSQTVSLSLGSNVGDSATLTRLETTSSLGVAATNQVYLHGQTFDGTADGHLVGGPVYSTVAPSAGTYTITLKDGSAAMLEVQL